MIVILLASGKGGTGKTTTTVMLAMALNRYYGLKVSLLDLDTCGPNLPGVLEMQTGHILQGKAFDENAFYPKRIEDDFEVFSSAFLMPEDVACAWDGRKRQDLIRELLLEVRWKHCTILLCDCPPGTGDEIIAVLTYTKKVDGVIIITTGARASVDDAKRLVAMMRSPRFNIPVLGIVENMGYRQEVNDRGDVTTTYRVFSDGIDYASELGVPVIAKIPFTDRIAVEDFVPLATSVVQIFGLNPVKCTDTPVTPEPQATTEEMKNDDQ